MNNLWDVPILSVITLTAERSIAVTRAILRAECGYAKLGPGALTISSRLTIADGGIDAEVHAPASYPVPSDCIFYPGLTGFQVKSGTAFKPWLVRDIRKELLTPAGTLSPEVAHVIGEQGRYTLLCTGHDLTPEQRHKSREHIAAVLAQQGTSDYLAFIDVLGASQIAEFAERYPDTASLLTMDPIQEGWVLDEWQSDDHLANAFEVSVEQSQLIDQIRSELASECIHLRVLGEPGLGKTRLVLEALRAPHLTPYVLYIQHGAQLGQTKLFRQLLKSGRDKPLILVIDELPETELVEIWRHLKPRCGALKIISLDHGRDETHDPDILRLNAPRLSDETIRKILVSQVGESHELDRWVAICEGSPRVAQAVADNLRANPSDILKPPATVPIWTRYIQGYGRRDELAARQIDCVTQHLALFSRFGYEFPVADEGIYIAKLIGSADATIGMARFQEIVQGLRLRRVLQGSRTLFFVPKALHIYLWRQFWERYGHGFDFVKILAEMPESLHGWFMSMFRFAGEAASKHVVNEILKPNGIFSDRNTLGSARGARFLSILAEADPAAVLRLLEATVGTWDDAELLAFSQHRQNIISAIEKAAVWSPLTVRAMRLLARFAVNETSDYANNATGTLTGLFRLGPDAAATEATPEVRLPALQRLLESDREDERRLGLKAMEAALDSRGMGIRIIGPEHQGLRPRAKLWMPVTYGDWWDAKFIYFQALVEEVQGWPSSLRDDVRQSLLNAVEQQIQTPPCTALALEVLESLINDADTSPTLLNAFFSHWHDHLADGAKPEIAKRMHQLERSYTKRDIGSRFQRYVIDASAREWEGLGKKNAAGKRARKLVAALASRIAQKPELLENIRPYAAPSTYAIALWHFGEQLALADDGYKLLSELLQMALETKHQVCLHGYLSAVLKHHPALYFSTMERLLTGAETAWLGATISLREGYAETLFAQCLNALEQRWVSPLLFDAITYGKIIEGIPAERLGRLLHLLADHHTPEATIVLLELLNLLPLDENTTFTPDFIFDVVSKSIPDGEDQGAMPGYYWKNISSKLIAWRADYALPLLHVLLVRMSDAYRLCYDLNVTALANDIVRMNPEGSWGVVREQLEASLPEWRGDLLHWLRGGFPSFNHNNRRAAIADLPINGILEWIDLDPEPRGELIARAVPRTLDDTDGGQLTREILRRYGHLKDVRSGVSNVFAQGGGHGPRILHLKQRRDEFRQWLAAGFSVELTQWIEEEIEHLDKQIEHQEIEDERSRFDF